MAPSPLLLALAALPHAAWANLRSWAEAQAMADRTLLSMTAYERHVLMKGSGWVPNPAGATLFPVLEPGYYMGNADGIPRLGVPALKLHDAGNGFRNNPMGGMNAFGTTTNFPSALALAATWDDELVSRTAKAIGEEFRAKGANVILGPGVQVHRVARNGRNFEYMSGEDPYLGARLAWAYVEAVQSTGVVGCSKHWAFNEQETNRMDSTSDVDEKTAWEIYYPPFEATVKAGVGSFMCGYNKVNGTYDCENEKLLKTDLKEKMGFNGFVMSDWFATHSPSVKQGLDQCMPGVEPYFWHDVLECMETGKDCDLLQPASPVDQVRAFVKSKFGNPNVTDPPGLPRDAAYKDAARRILAVIYRHRLEESPGCTPGPDCVGPLRADVKTPSHAKVAEDGAVQSVVLLKNEGALPIDPAKVKKVFMAGWTDPDPLHESPVGMPPADYYSGGGSGHTSANPWSVTKVAHAMTRRGKKAGIEVKHQAVFGAFNQTAFFESIKGSDLNIYVAATTATEGNDRGTLFLDMYANEMIGYMAEAGPTVVIMQTPGTVVLPWRNHPNITGIVNMFLGGEKTGPAWASILYGDVSPSGKLPIVFPKSAKFEIPPVEESKTIEYSEGMFFSYRAENAAEVAAYPFGFGLSYTTFAYSAPTQAAVAACAGAVQAWKDVSPVQACVTVEITNAGKRAGAEVAQAYVEFPKSTKMPKLMLKGFVKTKVLEPGAKEVVRFALTKRDLSVYEVSSSSWALQETVTLHVGASSADIRGVLEVHASGPKPAAPKAAAKEEKKPPVKEAKVAMQEL